ncbi:unnamed protein product, partial [Cuscuta epithymum]
MQVQSTFRTTPLISNRRPMLHMREKLPLISVISVCMDQVSRIRIGVGEQSGGLFYLAMGERVRIHNATHLDVGELWHARLGHPSLQVLNFLPQVNGSSSNLFNKPCDVCHRAKQTRSVF